MTAPTLSLFVGCAPGLERLLADELETLGGRGLQSIAGGVELDGTLDDVYRFNLASGLATFVRVRLATFGARHFGEIVRKAARLPWAHWLRPDVPIAVRATARRSRLYHTVGIADRVGEAIAETLSTPVGAPEVEIVVRMDRDRCTISLDTSGEPLHRRGWRLQTGKAPLREDLARALLVAATWSPDLGLVDPMAGAGTIAIEAAVMARALAPGRGRAFAFERLATFDKTRWQSVQADADARVRDAPAPIFARDRDVGALSAARGNAQRAGVEDDLTFVEADLATEPLPPVAALATNPPYGQRIGTRDAALRTLWSALGDAVRESATIRDVAVVCPDRRLSAATGLPLTPRALTDHGGTKIELMAGHRTLDRPRGRGMTAA